jgi:hypothetical protein
LSNDIFYHPAPLWFGTAESSDLLELLESSVSSAESPEGGIPVRLEERATWTAGSSTSSTTTASGSHNQGARSAGVKGPCGSLSFFLGRCALVVAAALYRIPVSFLRSCWWTSETTFSLFSCGNLANTLFGLKGYIPVASNPPLMALLKSFYISRFSSFGNACFGSVA